MLSPDIAHFLTQYSDQTIMDKYLSLLANDLGASKSPSIKAIHQEYQQKIKTYQNKMNQLESDVLSKTRSLEQSHRVQLQRYESEFSQLKQQYNSELNRYKSEIQQLKVSLENAKRTTSQSSIKSTTNYSLFNNNFNDLVKWFKELNCSIYDFRNNLIAIEKLNSSSDIFKVCLMDNSLNEIKDLTQLNNLKELYLSANKLTTLPIWLKHMKLNYLNIRNNLINVNDLTNQDVINALKRNNPNIQIIS